MLKKLLLPLVLAFWPCYSYSDSIAPYYGYTGNAITDQSLRWSMGNILPDPPGTEIENVIYSYEIEKETGDMVTVYVYNENANGSGYVFRERDDWMPGSISGTQINKIVPLGRLHRDLFGDGGIDVEGPGSVNNASVVYTYRVNPCYDPQFDPNCPGYELQMPDVPEIEYELYDALTSGDADQDEWNPNDENYDDEENELSEEELAEKEAEEEKDRKERLEEALFEAGRAQLFAEAFAMAAMKDSQQIDLNSYASKTIQGGEYNESIILQDSQLPDAQNGLRNGLAQQLLHQQMVDSQYRN